MKKKLIAGLAMSLLLAAGTCFAQVVEKTEDYKGNSINYPQVAGISAKAAKAINRYIVKEALGDAHKFIDKHGKEGGTAWLVTKVIRDDDRYLSLRIASASYFKGAVHPQAYVLGLVFDKETGEKLPLSHFVNMPSLDVYKYYCQQGKFVLYGPNGQPLTLEYQPEINYISEQYTLDENDNLDLYYQQYELGPYAIGSPYIRLDKEYVDHNGHVLPKG